jgi:hypothetical protein
MGLSTSGSTYLQGLTVIIDDCGSKLPLKPTKDGIAWSEQRTGEDHRFNLFAYAGGVAKAFWNDISNRFVLSDPKKTMVQVVASYVDDQKEATIVDVSANGMAGGRFQKYKVKWRKTAKGIIQKGQQPIEVEDGSDSIFNISEDRIATYASQVSQKKRKRDPNDPNLVTTDRAIAEGNPIHTANIVPNKRRAASKVDYTQERVIPALDKTQSSYSHKPRKKSKKACSNAAYEEKLLEMETQLRRSQLETVEAKKEASNLRAKVESLEQKQWHPAAGFTSLDELERLRRENEQLRARVQTLEQRRPPADRGTSIANARMQAQLQRLQEDQDRLKNQLKHCQVERDNYRTQLEASFEANLRRVEAEHHGIAAD